MNGVGTGAYRWRDAVPDHRMVLALDAAGPRPPATADRPTKNNWSAKFADSCAVMIASEMRKHDTFRKMVVRPKEDGSGREAITAASQGRAKKKVDVSASSSIGGLQIGVSLKGGNFADPGDGAYGKNVTGRIYELLDEVRVIHEYHPHAIVAGVYFMPLAAALDRPNGSTFARLVAKLRRHTHRSDPLSPTQYNRLDWSAVGLYVPADDDVYRRGVCAYFDTVEAPPQVGRPRLEQTRPLEGLVHKLATLYDERDEKPIEYSQPEPE